MPTKTPLLRLLMCYLCGIWAGDALYFKEAPQITGIALAAVVACLLLFHIKRFTLQRRWLRQGERDVKRQQCLRERLDRGSYLLLYLLLFLLAAALTMVQRPEEPPYPEERLTALWEVTTHPKQRTHSVTCEGRLLGLFQNGSLLHVQSDSLFRSLRPSLYRLYLSQGDSAAATLSPGVRIVAHCRLQPFKPLAGSPAFDYPTYARRRGWSGSTYLAAGQWQRVQQWAQQQQTDAGTLAAKEPFIARYRQWLLTLYRESGLTEAPLGIVTALTMGDKDLLPWETRQLFTEGGVAHLLALSGLHVGVLYALMMGLLFPLRRFSGGWRLLTLVWSLALIWGFALFTGLSASVVRSVTMYSLLAISLAMGSGMLTMNRLTAALLLMLIVRPYWLFDVGFQLSFCGVAAILWLQPPSSLTLASRSGWRYRLRQFVTVCLAAQVGTTPLVALYFGTFSPYFLLANLWCMPLVALLLYLTVGWLLYLAVRWLIHLAVGWLALLPFSLGLTDNCTLTDGGGLMSGVISGVVTLMTEGLRLIQRLPLAQITLPRPDGFELLLIYAMLLMLPSWWRKPIAHRTLSLLITLWLLAAYHYFFKSIIS